MTDPLISAFNRGATRVQNLAASRGDAIKLGKQRAVVTRVEWRGESWAVECFTLTARGTRLGSPRVSYFPPGGAPEPVGRWEGDLEQGSTGRVSALNPSDGASTVPPVPTTIQTSPKEGTMAGTTTKSARTVKVTRGKKTTGAKATGAKKAGATSAAKKPAPRGGSSNRQPRNTGAVEKITANVAKIAKALKGGTTMRALKGEYGVSDDGPIRRALYFAGFDSKGEKHGETADSINTKTAAGKKQVVKLRADEGAGWYRLAFLTGLSEAEVKKIVADAGGPTGRVYTKTEKPKAASRGR